jgi:hypothetical protein
MSSTLGFFGVSAAGANPAAAAAKASASNRRMARILI